MVHSRFKHCHSTIVLCIFALCLSGCGSFNQLNVQSGEFDVYIPSVFTGAGYTVKKDSSAKRISAQIKIQKEENLKLNKIWNKEVSGDDKTLPKEEANIAYRLKNFPVTVSYDYMTKGELWLASLGTGLDPFPYFRAYTGLNSSHFETGIGFQIDFGKYRYSLEGDWLRHCDTFEGDYDCGDGHLSVDEKARFSFTAVLGAYVGFIITKELALTYAPAIYFPWWSIGSFDNHDITFDFPFILEQYMGASYVLKNKYQISIGTTVYVGENFAGKHWQASTGVGYLF